MEFHIPKKSATSKTIKSNFLIIYQTPLDSFHNRINAPLCILSSRYIPVFGRRTSLNFSRKLSLIVTSFTSCLHFLRCCPILILKRIRIMVSNGVFYYSSYSEISKGVSYHTFRHGVNDIFV
jgi:hypothetical protein